MALPTTGPLSLNQIHVEVNGTSGTICSLNDPDIRSLLNPDKGANQANSISEYRGASHTVTFTYELIGGGGGGGNGREDKGDGVNRGATGGSSSIAASGISTITASGGQGGRAGMYVPNVNENLRVGQASHYGNGGTAGAHLPGNAGRGGDAPSTSYGAGGGGGGGDNRNNPYDQTGAGGEGGFASTRLTGTATVQSGTTVTITIGGGGAGRNVENPGGNGAGGFAKITANGNVTNFPSSGSITLTG